MSIYFALGADDKYLCAIAGEKITRGIFEEVAKEQLIAPVMVTITELNNG